MKSKTNNSALTARQFTREREMMEMTERLRRRTTRNVPAAGFFFTLAMWLLFMSFKFGAVRIEGHYFIPVESLAVIAVAIGLIYAGTGKAFVRTSDKVLYLLMNEIVKSNGQISHLSKLSKQTRAEQAADGKTPEAPQSPH